MGNVGVWKTVATNESVIWSAALFRRFCFLRRQKGRKSSEAEVVVELRVEGKTALRDSWGNLIITGLIWAV
jgi:hypothetical protein